MLSEAVIEVIRPGGQRDVARHALVLEQHFGHGAVAEEEVLGECVPRGVRAVAHLAVEYAGRD